MTNPRTESAAVSTATPHPVRDLREHLDVAPMSFYQWAIVAAAVLMNTLDGFDVAAMAFSAVRVQQEFDLTAAGLGIVISATLIGMAIGSISFGRLADVIGRRATVLTAVALATLGMYLAATAVGVVQLGIWRVITGLGVGGILTSITVITAEYSSARWRGLAIGIFSAGYGVGATLGGLAAVNLQDVFGWRAVFLAGALVSTVLLLALIFLLPESVQFLMRRRPAGAERRLRAIALKVGFDPELATLDGAPSPGTGAATDAPQASERFFSRATIVATLLLWAAFFATMFAFYFVNSWTPRLMVDAGMTVEQGVVVGMSLALGGAVGAVLYGIGAARINHEKLLIGFLVLSAVLIVLFVLSTSILFLAFGLGVLVGMSVNACIAGLYTVAPAHYTTVTRATGVGAAIAVGRGGAILAPILAGVLLDAGWSSVALYSSTGALLVLAAVAIVFLRRRPAQE